MQGSKRSRGRGRKSSGNVNRSFDSNGPDVKVRGTATHIFEKYQQLARDAQSSGDKVLSESYLQHAEHYYRVMMAMQPPGQPMHRPTHGQSSIGYGDLDDDEYPEFGAPGAPQPSFGQPYAPQPYPGQGGHQPNSQPQNYPAAPYQAQPNGAPALGDDADIPDNALNPQRDRRPRPRRNGRVRPERSDRDPANGAPPPASYAGQGAPGPNGGEPRRPEGEPRRAEGERRDGERRGEPRRDQQPRPQPDDWYERRDANQPTLGELFAEDEDARP